MKSLKVGVVGAGIAGIATAIRLAAKGNQVSVFESNSYPGGKLSEVRLGNYRFDAGPSLFTFPKLVEELFELAGEDYHDNFEYIRLNRAANYFFEDGTTFQAPGTKQDLTEVLGETFLDDTSDIEKFFRKSNTMYDYLGEMFMFNSLHDWRTFVSKSAFRSYANIPKMGFFDTMARSNEKDFKDPRLVQFFNRYATYNGSNPYATPATMNLISHLEYGIGAFFPKKGMHSITTSLVALAERLGVEFHLGEKVSAIELDNAKRVKGLKVGNEVIEFDRVVSNMDIVGTYRHLLKEVPAPNKILKQPKSSSALIFYWGISQEFPQLDLHNILFSGDYKEEFDHIFNRKNLYKDPTVYINITSKHKSDDAPAGAENWFTMINTPHNTGQDWDQLIEKAKSNILEKLYRILKVDVSSFIEEESLLDPRLIESKTSSSQGALYGNSSNNKYAAFLRHANFSNKIKGLYFCGGSVHPGGGIPMALSSAKIVDRYFQ